MQLEFLCSLKSTSFVKKRLGMLPPNLHKIYEENYSQKFESYQEEERRIVESAFRLLLCAQERLSTNGLLKALSVLDPEDESLSPDLLLHLCFNFLDVDSQLDAFRFAHLSVREYLESKGNYERTSSHALAAECCLRLLSSDEVIKRGGCFGHIATDVTTDPTFWKDTALRLTDFHEYACIHWSFHLASSGNFRLTSPLKDTSYAFMMDHQQATSDAYWVWNRDAYWYSSNTWYPGCNELRDKLRWAISSFPAADYLFAACVWDFEDILEIRIRAAPNPINGQVIHDSGRALALAAKFESCTAIRLLFEHGVDPKWSSLGRTSLNESDDIRSPEEIFQVILSDHSADDEGITPLSWAVKNGDLEMTKTLLNDPNERPLLQQAIQTGRTDMLWALLENEADLNVDRNWWGSPVWFAAGKGDLKMLRMLFCRGAHAPTEFRDSEGRKHQLKLVQKCLNADVVQLLQERGCTFEHEVGLRDWEGDLGSLHLRWMQFRQYPEHMHLSGNRRRRPRLRRPLGNRAELMYELRRLKHLRSLGKN